MSLVMDDVGKSPQKQIMEYELGLDLANTCHKLVILSTASC